MSRMRDNEAQLREVKMSASERTAFADVQNISHNRSVGSQKSRDSHVDSPVARPSNKRLLTQDMFDDSDDEISSPKQMTSFMNPIDRLRSSHTNSTMRRTKSDVSSMDCTSHHSHSHLSVNMSHFDLSDMQIELDEVFMEDTSPNISAISVASGHQLKHHEDERVTASCFAVNRAASPDVFQDYILHGVENPQTPSRAYRSISPHVLAKVLEEHGEEFTSKFTLVDCRYPYEYAGGHIKGAVNINDPALLEGIFFPSDKAASIWTRIPIFYCEFSQKRGPTMAHKLRSLDRSLNELNYPHLHYCEVYLIDGGYNNFWGCEIYKSFCEPSDYVSMFDERHGTELAKYDTHKKRGSRRVQIFSRHQSLLNLNDESMDSTDFPSGMHKATSVANFSFGTCHIKKRLDFDFD